MRLRIKSYHPKILLHCHCQHINYKQSKYDDNEQEGKTSTVPGIVDNTLNRQTDEQIKRFLTSA